MLKANVMKVVRKIVGRTKIHRIRSQQIRESFDILPINEWVRRRRREWDAKRLVEISRNNISTARSPGRPKRLNPLLKQMEPSITRRLSFKEIRSK